MASTLEVLQVLNNISVGPLTSILQRLDRAQDGLEELGHEELAGKVLEARRALLSGEEGLFQKRVAHVTSKLGHLK